MSANNQPEPVAWLSVAALIPRDGHAVGEVIDVIGVILDVTDLRLKDAQISSWKAVNVFVQAKSNLFFAII